MKLDIEANRAIRKYTRGEQLRRLLWAAGQFLFRLSPRPLFGFRCWLLRRFGASIGTDVHIDPTARIYFPWMLEIGDFSAIGEHAFVYNLGKVHIGQRATISHGAHLCAGSHDYANPSMPLLRPPITIGDDSWICADAFVGPGVHVGNGAVVGARAAVFKDVEAWTVVGGNPAAVLKTRELTKGA